MSSRRLVALVLLIWCGRGEANPLRNFPVLKQTNRKLAGQVLDYTANHGSDNRMWSDALCTKRDLYVYLPPGYDPKNRYPLVIWLHGFAQDEMSFLKDVIPSLDQAIACGKLAPVIIVAPDGSIQGRICFGMNSASFLINSKAGNFNDYLMTDVWNFVHERFPIRPEREAHVIGGVSMGAGAAFNKAFKYRDRFKVVLGVFPPLNTRWENERGRYRANFDPNDWNFRTDWTRKFEVIARFSGIMAIRLWQLTKPLYGKDTDITDRVIADNPLEILLNSDIKPDELAMYIGYAGRDEFNVDAQVESFLYFTKPLGFEPTVRYSPRGRHNRATALTFVPSILDFLEPHLAPYMKPSP